MAKVEVTEKTIINIRNLTAERVSFELITTATIGDRVYPSETEWFIRENSEQGRADVQEQLEANYPDYYNAAMAVWGDEPTVFHDEGTTESD